MLYKKNCLLRLSVFINTFKINGILRLLSPKFEAKVFFFSLLYRKNKKSYISSDIISFGKMFALCNIFFIYINFLTQYIYIVFLFNRIFLLNISYNKYYIHLINITFCYCKKYIKYFISNIYSSLL